MEDAADSFRRIFEVNSPTSGIFHNLIVGADACIQTPATCTLAGGVEADASRLFAIEHTQSVEVRRVNLQVCPRGAQFDTMTGLNTTLTREA